MMAFGVYHKLIALNITKHIFKLRHNHRNIEAKCVFFLRVVNPHIFFFTAISNSEAGDDLERVSEEGR